MQRVHGWGCRHSACLGRHASGVSERVLPAGSACRVRLKSLTSYRSLHLDVFSQIGRNVEIFALDDGWLALFKPAARDRLEL
jgi:hypothetical protein